MTSTAAETTDTRAEAITHGWQVYRRLAAIDWPREGREEIGRYSGRLQNALLMHSRLEGEVSEWTLGRYELQAKDATVLLAAAIRQHCGEQAARFIAEGGKRP